MKTFVNFLKESMNEPNAFVILKPEFLNNDQEWKNMLKDHGWNFLTSEQKKLTLDQAKDLYSPHKDKDFYDELCKYMSSGECICADCYKDCKDPVKDMEKVKDKVRKKWGINDMKNVMHSSDSPENVKRESQICLH